VARARRAWDAANDRLAPREALLAPITLHEARHTFASLMIAAGVNAQALASYMGHASITITLDRYGHLMPGNEDEAAALLDAYLERAETRARLAAVSGVSLPASS
jgi:integrase